MKQQSPGLKLRKSLLFIPCNETDSSSSHHQSVELLQLNGATSKQEGHRVSFFLFSYVQIFHHSCKTGEGAVCLAASFFHFLRLSYQDNKGG